MNPEYNRPHYLDESQKIAYILNGKWNSLCDSVHLAKHYFEQEYKIKWVTQERLDELKP